MYDKVRAPKKNEITRGRNKVLLESPIYVVKILYIEIKKIKKRCLLKLPHFGTTVSGQFLFFSLFSLFLSIVQDPVSLLQKLGIVNRNIATTPEYRLFIIFVIDNLWPRSHLN